MKLSLGDCKKLKVKVTASSLVESTPMVTVISVIL